MGLTRITSDGITDGTISTADLADQSVTLAKLPHGTSSNDGKFLRANNGADPTFETVNTDLSADSSPQLGGDLASNGNNINMADDDIINVGSSNDLRIRHNGVNSLIEDMGTGNLQIRGDDVHITGTNDEILAKFIENTGVELYHDGSAKKLETTSSGISVTGTVTSSSHIISGGMVDISDNNQLRLGNSQDMMISHDGSSSGAIRNATGELYLRSDGIRLVNNGNDETYIKCIDDGAVELYHNNSKKLETTSTGIKTQGAGQVSYLIGSTDAGGALLVLDGDSDGDGANADYSFIRHNTSGDLEIYARNPSGNADIKFFVGNGTSKARFDDSGNLRPENNNDVDLGNSNKRWANVYTNDLSLSNEGSANDVDGTWGSYTIQEGEESLFLINRRNGKKYKFNLTEVV